MKECAKCGGTGKVPDEKKVGRSIMRKRLRSGVSLRKTAKHLGISPAYLSDIEKGRRALNGPKARLVVEHFGFSQ